MQVILLGASVLPPLLSLGLWLGLQLALRRATHPAFPTNAESGIVEMKRLILCLLCLSIVNTAFPQENREARRCRRGQAAGYATRDATVLSMMGWGLAMAVGIAAITGLIDNDKAPSSSNANGNNNHS